MAALTTLNITEKNANNSLSVTVKVNITKKRSVYHYFIKRRCGQDSFLWDQITCQQIRQRRIFQ